MEFPIEWRRAGLIFRQMEPAKRVERRVTERDSVYCGCEETYDCCRHCNHYGCHTCHEDSGEYRWSETDEAVPEDESKVWQYYEH